MASLSPLCKMGDLNRLLSKALFFLKDKEQARKMRDLFGKASGNRWLVLGEKLASQEMQISSLGWEHPLEEETAAHTSIVAWEIPWTEELGEPKELDMTYGLNSEQTTKFRRKEALWVDVASSWHLKIKSLRRFMPGGGLGSLLVEVLEWQPEG